MIIKQLNRLYGLISLSIIVLMLTFFSTPSFSQSSPSISIGAYGGATIHLTDRAMSGYDDRWTNGDAFGVSALYRFKNGLAIELFGEQITMNIKDSYGEWGEMEITPVFLLLKYQSLPENQRGFSFHGGGGLGYASSDVKTKRDDFSEIIWSTDSAILFEGDLGLDYFFTKSISLALDARLIIGEIGSSFTYMGMPGWDVTFKANNLQFLGGLKVWF